MFNKLCQIIKFILLLNRDSYIKMKEGKKMVPSLYQYVLIAPTESSLEQQKVINKQMKKQKQIVQAQIIDAPIINAPLVLQSEAFYLVHQQWKKGNATIENNIFRIKERKMFIHQLDKIKFFKETSSDNARKIKLGHNSNEIFFSVPSEVKLQNLPLFYYWFAKIVTLKLQINDYDVKKPFVPEKKFTNKNIKNPDIDGLIFKKARYWNIWEQRYVAITKDGLFSCKDETSKQTFFIKKGTVTELWTWFQVFEKLLIIKVRHDGRKTQFTIPITNYCVESSTNWLYQFYKLIDDD